jgi:hypothetical protein
MQGIRHNRRVPGDRRAPDGEKLEAHAFLVRLVGDIHQPLHAADKNDRGGNDAKVVYLGVATYPRRDGSPAQFNLHGVRDTPLVGAAVADDGRAAIPAEIDALLRRRVNVDPARWARVRHQRAVECAYGALPITMTPGAPPLAPGSVDQTYVDRATPVMRTQLARATPRLVVTLNVTLQ